MALADFFNLSASLQRQGGGVDASGAQISSPFATISTGLACAVWPNAATSAVAYGLPKMIGDYVLAFGVNPAAKVGDRMQVGSVYYLVRGLMPFSNPIVTSETLYLVNADLWT